MNNVYFMVEIGLFKPFEPIPLSCCTSSYFMAGEAPLNPPLRWSHAENEHLCLAYNFNCPGGVEPQHEHFWEFVTGTYNLEEWYNPPYFPK